MITLLTGRRPDLLSRTLDSLRAFDCPTPIHVLHNGGDPETAEVLRSFHTVVTTTERWLDVGEATSACAAMVEGDYWLHLEDDWEATAPIPPVLEAAVASGLAQVRLRRTDDGARRRHYLTGKPIRWEGDGILTGDAHATWNPAVMPVWVAGLYPVKGEVEFMEKMAAHRVGQASPGVFRHIGKGRSLT